jgi:predicted branched-subunit amino acid permease
MCDMKNKRADFLKGAKAISPLIAGVSPFGMIYGVTAANTGLSDITSILMSVIIFAGSAQIALVDLLKDNASVFTILATVFLINLRMAMYGASISGYIRGDNIFIRMFSAYFLTDQAFAISIGKFTEDKQVCRIPFYLGGAITLWVAWQISTVIGVLLGKTLPKGLSLEFAIPLTFLAVTVPFLKEKYFVVTALVTGIIMILTRNLPYHLGFFIAVFSGIFAGLIFKRIFVNGK